MQIILLSQLKTKKYSPVNLYISYNANKFIYENYIFFKIPRYKVMKCAPPMVNSYHSPQAYPSFLLEKLFSTN